MRVRGAPELTRRARAPPPAFPLTFRELLVKPLLGGAGPRQLVLESGGRRRFRREGVVQRVLPRLYEFGGGARLRVHVLLLVRGVGAAVAAAAVLRRAARFELHGPEGLSGLLLRAPGSPPLVKDYAVVSMVGARLPRPQAHFHLIQRRRAADEVRGVISTSTAQLTARDEAPSSHDRRLPLTRARSLRLPEEHRKSSGRVREFGWPGVEQGSGKQLRSFPARKDLSFSYYYVVAEMKSCPKVTSGIPVMVAGLVSSGGCHVIRFGQSVHRTRLSPRFLTYLTGPDDQVDRTGHSDICHLLCN